MTLIVVMLLFASCLLENIQAGKDGDTKEEIKLLEAFYSNVSNQHYEKIDAIVADSLKKYVGKHGISKMIINLQNKVGVYKGYILISMTIKKAYYSLFY